MCVERVFTQMLTSARCLTNLLEALPRAQPIVIEAVPFLLEKVRPQRVRVASVAGREKGRNMRERVRNCS